jgi:hypothetical protein
LRRCARGRAADGEVGAGRLVARSDWQARGVGGWGRRWVHEDNEKEEEELGGGEGGGGMEEE